MLTFHTLLKGGAFLGVASTLLTISAPAARAQPAPVGPCGDTAGSIVIGTPGFSCKIGDKIYRNFSASGDALGSAEAQFQWSKIGTDQYNLSVQSVFNPGTYTLTYNVDITDTNNVFKELRTSATSSGTDPSPVWQKSLAAVPPTTPSPLIATATSPGGASVIGIFPDDVKTAPFTSTLTVTANSVTQIQDTLTQKPHTSSVPGPLPLLGAGAAFGFSRKLRRRIKVVA